MFLESLEKRYIFRLRYLDAFLREEWVILMDRVWNYLDLFLVFKCVCLFFGKVIYYFMFKDLLFFLERRFVIFS